MPIRRARRALQGGEDLAVNVEGNDCHAAIARVDLRLRTHGLRHMRSLTHPRQCRVSDWSGRCF